MDKVTEKLEEAIRHVLDKIAPIKIIKFNHKHIRDWYTDELPERVSQRNGGQRRQQTQKERQKR